MRVALVGDGVEAEIRATVLRTYRSSSISGVDVFEQPPDVDARHAAIPPETGVVFSSSSIHHFSALSEVARRGVHLFLEWPGSASVPECQALARLGEEAGIEIGISRPLRFYPWPDAGSAAHVDVLTIRQRLDVHAPGRWKRALEDAVDLALFFARGASPHRIDATVARSGDRLPLATVAGLRFHNGTYAQIEVRHQEGADATFEVGIAGPGFLHDVDLSEARAPGIRAETAAFLEAIAANRPPPVSVLDALQTIRLMEKLMERLRT